MLFGVVLVQAFSTPQQGDSRFEAYCKRLAVLASWPSRLPLSASARRMRSSHCCLPFCRCDCTLDAAACALSLSLSLWLPAGTPVREACALPGAQRCRERACSALRSGVTLSWHRHRQPQRQRPQRLHMKTRALLALIRLGPGGVDAATATSPHRELRVLPCQEVRFVFIVLVLLRCARASVPFVYPSICPSVRASICPPLVVSKRRVLVFTICRCWSQSRCHHNKTAPTSTPSPTTSNQLRHGTG